MAENPEVVRAVEGFRCLMLGALSEGAHPETRRFWLEAPAGEIWHRLRHTRGWPELYGGREP